MALVESSIEKAVAVAVACGWMALGGGLEAGVAVILSGLGAATAVSQSIRSHGPESKRALKAIRKRVSTDLRKRANVYNWEKNESFKAADAALDRALAGCFLDRKSLAASARNMKEFPTVATELILSKLAESEPEVFGPNGSNISKEYAKEVIQVALEATLDNEMYFKSLAPHLAMESLRGIGELQVVVTQGFKTVGEKLDLAAQEREKHKAEIISELKPLLQNYDELPDKLPEPILIEANRSLPKKKFLRGDFWNAKLGCEPNSVP